MIKQLFLEEDTNRIFLQIDRSLKDIELSIYNETDNVKIYSEIKDLEKDILYWFCPYLDNRIDISKKTLALCLDNFQEDIQENIVFHEYRTNLIEKTSLYLREFSTHECDTFVNNLNSRGLHFDRSYLIRYEPSFESSTSTCFFVDYNYIENCILNDIFISTNHEDVLLISKEDNIDFSKLKEKVFNFDYARLGNKSSFRSKRMQDLCNKFLKDIVEVDSAEDLIEIEYRRLFDLEEMKFLKQEECFYEESQKEFTNSNYTRFGKEIPKHGRDGFKTCFNLLLEQNKQDPNILEIGSQRSDNLSDGCSTELFDWFCRNYCGKFTSVDIDNSFIRNKLSKLQEVINATLVECDAIEYLDRLSTNIDLLYLDAWDWNGSDEDKKISEEKHLEFFKKIEDRLNDGCLILIDDIMNENLDGKGKLLIPYMISRGYKLVQKTYQYLFLLDKSNIKEEQIFKNEVLCPNCYSDQYTSYTDSVNICNDCSLLYHNQKLQFKDLYAEYQNLANSGSHLYTPYDLEDADYNEQLKREDWVKIVENLDLGYKPNVVDIGCGWGAFLNELKNSENKYFVKGYELTRKNANFAKNTLGISVENYDFRESKINNELDLVSMFHVLEHVQDPLSMLFAILNSLVDGGYFIGAVPNIESFASKKMGKNWPWLESYLHITHFSLETLRNMLEKIGFEVEKMWTVTNFQDFPKKVYNELLSVYEEKELKRKVKIIEETSQGEEIRFIVKKPKSVILSNDSIERLLFNFYEKKSTKGLKNVTDKVDFNNSIISNPAKGLGDLLVLTPIPSIALEEEKIITIETENNYLNKLEGYFYNKPSNIKLTENLNNYSMYGYSKQKLGGGHVIQLICKALNLEPPLKPSPEINYKSKDKIHNSVVFHLEKSNRQWHSDVMRRPVGNISKNTLEVIKSFASLNDYSFAEVSVNGGRLSNLDNVKQLTNLELLEVIKEIAKYEYFIGMNSGIMHIAVALGLKCIVLSNFPNVDEFYLPKLRYELYDFELEWCYPQNVHLYEDGENELVKKINILNLQRAIKGEIYPFWKDDFLPLVKHFDNSRGI